jgi:pimeloyl-ACP methyl ester carboxylesterase
MLLALAPGCVHVEVTDSVIFPAPALMAFDPGLPLEEIRIRTQDGLRLDAWLVWKDAPRTLLTLHAEGESLKDLVAFANLVHAELPVNLMLVDYRGFGGSGGVPTGEGLLQDGRAALEYLIHQRRVPPSALVVYGLSLGAALAVDLASHHELGGLVIERPFVSVPALVDEVRRLAGSVEDRTRVRFDNLVKIRHHRGALLVIQSREGEMDLAGHAVQLHDACPSANKQLVAVREPGGFSWEVDPTLFVQAMRGFLDALGSTARGSP